jgi:uncharacterized membrane protein YqjE
MAWPGPQSSASRAVAVIIGVGAMTRLRASNLLMRVIFILGVLRCCWFRYLIENGNLSHLETLRWDFSAR